MANAIIVHGEKSVRSCAIHPAFVERLKKAILVAQEGGFDAVVITGGQTRKGSPFEAKMGRDYIKEKVSIPILLEAEARTTSENVRYSQKILEDKKLDKIVIITSRRRIFRAKYLYKRLWKETRAKIEFVGTPDFYPLGYCLIEFLYLLYDILDPQEKTLARFTKKIFRNK